MRSNITKETLEALYITQRLNIKTVGKQLGIAYSTTNYYLNKFSIPRRTTSEMLKGVKKTDEHKRKLSESKKGNKHPSFGKKCPVHGKRCFWKEPSGQIVSLRSAWEAAYAEHLDKQNINWQYEAKTFITTKGGYTPDFYLSDTNEFVEIKGWLTDKHKKRIQTFRKEYPEIKFTLLMKTDLLKAGLDLNKEYVGLERSKKTCVSCNKAFIPHDQHQLFCSKSCSSKVCRKKEWIVNKNNKPTRQYKGNQTGSYNNGSKLKETQVIYIIKLHKQGATIAEIVKKTGASAGNVSNIVNNKSWKHISR